MGLFTGENKHWILGLHQQNTDQYSYLVIQRDRLAFCCWKNLQTKLRRLKTSKKDFETCGRKGIQQPTTTLNCKLVLLIFLYGFTRQSTGQHKIMIPKTTIKSCSGLTTSTFKISSSNELLYNHRLQRIHPTDRFQILNDRVAIRSCAAPGDSELAI